MRFFQQSAAWLMSVLAFMVLAGCSVTNQSDSLSRADNAQALTAYNWMLSSQDSGLQQAVSLSFDEGRLTVAGLCNTLGASYQLEGKRIKISEAFSSMMMCPEEAVMQAEKRIGAQLPKATSWQINTEAKPQPILDLRFNDGKQWLLAGEPTDETRYGSAPETIFLEVQASTVACPDNTADKNCLRVRELSYNDKGLQEGAGPWQVVPNQIKGYQHEAGIRNVLRIKRYPLEAGKVPPYADVLDLVVESERVN